METRASEGTGGPSARLAVALWFGLALGLGRCALLFAMERFGHGVELERVLRRLGHAAQPALVAGLGVAAGGALLVGLVPRGRGRRPVALIVMLAIAAGVAAFGAGWIGWDASRSIGVATDRGRAAAGALALAALVGACAFVLASLRARPRSPLALAPPLVLAGALALLAPRLLGGLPDEMTVVHTVGTLLDDGGAWDPVAVREDRGPAVGVICPSEEYGVDGSDMAALVLPPPCEVARRVPSDVESALLVARAGFDRRVLFGREGVLAGHAVRFELELDGRPVWRTEIEVAREGENPGTSWRDVPEVFVRAGDELRLRTTLLGPDGRPKTWPEPLDAGFGGLRLERRTTRPRARSGPDRPNVVLVVMDTLRADRLTPYGYDRDTSPHLAELAERGLVFDAAHATASWTWPSTASILTGLLPQEHGVLDPDSCYLADAHRTLAEALQGEGFTTAAWSANPLIVPDRNFDQGFEFFEYRRGVTRKSRLVVPGALEWLREVAGTRFFLYLHLTDPHAPLAPLPEGRERFAAHVPAAFPTKAIIDYHGKLLENCAVGEDGRAALERCVPDEHRQWIDDLYDACVWTGDHWLGRVMAELDALGLTDETVVAFTSDHGEELFDHGLATHGHALWGELVRVPLVIAGPGVPRGRVATPISNRHLGPTLAGLVGAPMERADDALDLVRSADGLERRPVFFSTDRGWWKGRHPEAILGMRSGDRVLHWAPGGAPWSAEPSEAGDVALFDLAADPGEARDLAGERGPEAEALRAALERRMAELEARRLAPGVAAGQSTLRMLREIGYVGDDE